MRTGMGVALAILHVLVPQVGRNTEGIQPLSGQVEPATVPEDMWINGKREPCSLGNGTEEVIECEPLQGGPPLGDKEMVKG